MSMVCDMPEWKSNDLWIETTPPHLPQETSLVWEKQARFYNDFQVGQTFFHSGVSLYAGWRVECQSEIDSTWTFPDSVEIDRATRSNLRQSTRWQYWYIITILQFFNFMTFDLAWFSASSKEREELKVRLVSGVERQTNTFEVKMMLTVLLMMIMMERQ